MEMFSRSPFDFTSSGYIEFVSSNTAKYMDLHGQFLPASGPLASQSGDGRSGAMSLSVA
jgi:hypothetical protein